MVSMCRRMLVLVSSQKINCFYLPQTIMCLLLGLGHARLSIIDVPTGQQSLSDEDELVHCVVTGEIYDNDRLRAELHSQGYSFKTQSDSELVVQL